MDHRKLNCIQFKDESSSDFKREFFKQKLTGNTKISRKKFNTKNSELLTKFYRKITNFDMQLSKKVPRFYRTINRMNINS